MKGDMYERCKEEALYMLLWRKNIRQTAKKFGISKSTIHLDVTTRLMKIDPRLAQNVKAFLNKQKEERHIRGGVATKKKYERLRNI